MAAAANIVINDGQATPVAHTFVPARKDGTLVEYEERTTAHTPNGFYTLAISQTAPKSSSAVIRSKVTLAVPIEVLDTSTSSYSYENICRITFDCILPKSATAAIRSDLAAYAKNLLAHTVVQAMVANLDAPF